MERTFLHTKHLGTRRRNPRFQLKNQRLPKTQQSHAQRLMNQFPQQTSKTHRAPSNLLSWSKEGPKDPYFGPLGTQESHPIFQDLEGTHWTLLLLI